MEKPLPAGHVPQVTGSAHLRVAFAGELGSDAEAAARQLYSADCISRPCPSFRAAAAAVAAGDADCAVFAVENTLTGSVGEAHDVIDQATGLHAVAETGLDVRHCLVGPRGASLETITSVLADAAAIAQCATFLNERGRTEKHVVPDRAAAARDVAELGDPSFGAVASRFAAERYGLMIVAADIGDAAHNQTRFLALAPTSATVTPDTPVRTMIVFTPADAPGALLRSLQPFAEHALNLRRIECRPAPVPWRYRFFLEFDHTAGDASADAAVASVLGAVPGVRVVGTFPRWPGG